jgi:hypothetical protein
VKHVYIIVISACLGYIAKHYHWPYLIAVALILMIITFAFLVARLVEDDRR